MSLECVIRKSFPSFCLDVAFEADDEVHALLGASGCGKSMILRCIAGIETPDEGRIVLNGRTLYDSASKINLPSRERRAGLLFQHFALFPHLSVLENIRLAVPGRDLRRAKEYVERCRLNDSAHLHPEKLSGGQRQRCALARMIAHEPDILMLDEPFSALDSFLRWQIEREIVSEIESFRGTVLLVSHNRDEVFRICDRVTTMVDGKNAPARDKRDLFFSPRTYADALLTGCKNIVPARREGRSVILPDYSLRFSCPKDRPGFDCIGIRAKAPIVAARAVPSRDYIIAEYEIIRQLDNLSSHILTLRLNGAGTPFYWEVPNECFEEAVTSCQLAIPMNEILYLLKEQRE